MIIFRQSIQDFARDSIQSSRPEKRYEAIVRLVLESEVVEEVTGKAVVKADLRSVAGPSDIKETTQRSNVHSVLARS